MVPYLINTPETVSVAVSKCPVCFRLVGRTTAGQTGHFGCSLQANQLTRSNWNFCVRWRRHAARIWASFAAQILHHRQPLVKVNFFILINSISCFSSFQWAAFPTVITLSDIVLGGTITSCPFGCDLISQHPKCQLKKQKLDTRHTRHGVVCKQAIVYLARSQFWLTDSVFVVPSFWA